MPKELALFLDQQEIMSSLRDAMAKYRAILLQSPTGSGKTAMAIYMILKSVAKLTESEHLKHAKLIFTVPRKDLLEQTSETLRGYGIAHSFIASGKPYNPFAKVMIGMVDTMANRILVDDEGKVVEVKLPLGYITLIDETHFGAASLGKVIENFKKPWVDAATGKTVSPWVIGLSATPWKLNGEGLGMWYEFMVEGKPIKWLIDNKRLSDYDYYYGKTKPDLSKLKVSGGDYAKGELGEFMEKQGAIIGDCVNEYKQRCAGKLHIVRCASIRHSQMVAASFVASGVPAVHVDGDTPMDERKRIFKAYARREIMVLTFCDLLNFGFDLSQASGMDVCIESASDLKPTLSLAGQMQFWGRVLRMKPYNAVIIDHVNNYLKHGLPCSDREWTLESRKKNKKGAPSCPIKQCPSCRCVHPPRPQCPQCGYTYEVVGREIENVDGELHKIDKETARIKSLENRKKQGQCKTFEELVAHFRELGHKAPAFQAKLVMDWRNKNQRKQA